MNKRPAKPTMPKPAARTPDVGQHVVLIGLGVIGSHALEFLARTPSVTRFTLVDCDVYEPHNLFQQAIQPEDVGKSKAEVQAARARKLRPGLQVEAIHAAVEDVPVGRLRGDVVFTGLDSKLARQIVNHRVWRLGIPWVDAGVMAADRLARVNVYRPGAHQPCLECAWGEREYQTLEVKRPCLAEAGPRTDAPAFLGSLAAALQMAEGEKILAGDWPSVAVGKQITVAAAAHKLYETLCRANPNCHFDHHTGSVHPLRCDLHASSLGGLLAELKEAAGISPPVRLTVEGSRFERQLRCACGEVKDVFNLAGRMAAIERTCTRCGAVMEPVGFALLPQLDEAALQREERDRPLAALGFQHGDFINLSAGEPVTTFELTAP